MSEQKKKKSIFRTEAFFVIGAILIILVLYFTLFFSLHLKWIAERTLTKVYGAEVNIKSLKIGIDPPTLTLKDIGFTNHQKPTHNIVEIGNLSVRLNTRDLLFASFTVEEALMTSVRIDRKRKRRGYVSPESQKLVSLSLDLKKNKKTVLENKSKGNILENILSFSKSKDLNSELKKLADEFQIDELTNKYESKLKTNVDLFKKYESLVDSDQFKDLEVQFKNIETKINNKASTLDVIADGKNLIDQIKTKKDQVKDLNKQLKTQIADFKNLKNEFKKDLNDKKLALKNKFKIPDISPEALAQDFFAETVSTRFYLFKYWLEQARKNSEDKIENVSSKVLSKEKAKFVKEKIESSLEASKKEKEINIEIADLRTKTNQIIHFGSDVRPKVWVKKTIIRGEAKKNQDLQNFSGVILNVADDQKLIGKPIDIKFSGDLPKDNIYNMKISALLNHHVQDINEVFDIAADYPISSFKIFNDDSLKLFLKKAASNTHINGKLLKNEINNLSIRNNLSDVNFLFNSSKGDIQDLLSPIFEQIKAFDVNVFLEGALDNPNFKIISSLTEKISAGLKDQISGQLNKFNQDLESKLSEKTAELQNKIFGSIDSQESKLNTQLDKLNLQLDDQKKRIDDLLKKNSSSKLNDLTEKLGDKLFKKSSKKK